MPISNLSNLMTNPQVPQLDRSEHKGLQRRGLSPTGRGVFVKPFFVFLPLFNIFLSCMSDFEVIYQYIEFDASHLKNMKLTNSGHDCPKTEAHLFQPSKSRGQGHQVNSEYTLNIFRNLYITNAECRE